MKVPIIDLMDYYYGEDAARLVSTLPEASASSAQTPQRRSKRHTVRRNILVAASLAMIIACTAFALSLRRYGQDTGTAAAEGSGVETSWGVTDTASLSEADTACVLASAYADAKLYVPASEKDEFKVDTAFTYSYSMDGSTDGEPKAVTYDADRAIYAYFDSGQEAYGRDGLVWLIYRYTTDDLEAILGNDSLVRLTINWRLLGVSGDTVYTLFCIAPDFMGTYAAQLEWENLESVQSYYAHLETGFSVLEDFVEKNALTVPDGYVDWMSWYQENLLDVTKAQMGTLTAAQDEASAEPTPNVGGIAPVSATAAESYDFGYAGSGNLVLIDGTYYTATENGLEAVETQNVSTTIDLYGSWEVDFDYAIIDGELVLHNNTSTDSYAEIDGEIVTQSQWIEEHQTFGYPLDDTTTAEEPTWISASVATADRVNGHSDLVELTIRRTDKGETETCHYSLFYNITTGEISDPLANIPDLFDYGDVSYAIFNDDLSKALVEVFAIAYLEDGSTYTGEPTVYVCDLESGTMTATDTLLSPYYPEAETEGTYITASDNCVWADNDTFLFWLDIAVPNGADVETDGWVDEYDRTCWLYSYNLDTGTVNYQAEDTTVVTGYSSGNQRYLHEFDDEAQTESILRFTVIDTGTGESYLLPDANFYDLNGLGWSGTDTRTALLADDGTLYLVDDESMGYVNLNSCLSLPEEEITGVYLLADNRLCLTTGDTVYCYILPDSLDFQPLTAD